MQKFFITLFLFLFLVGTGVSWAADEEFRIWNKYDVDKKINDQWTFSLGEELRFQDNATQFVRTDTHASIKHKTFSFLTLRGEYKNIRSKGSDGKWLWEYRPRMDAILKYDLKGFVFTDRNRFEFRIKEDKKNTFRYRNQISLTLPYKWTRFEIQPYIADELFFETSKNGLTQNRFYTGFKMHIFKGLYGTISYLRLSSKNSKAQWTESNVVVTSLKLKF